MEISWSDNVVEGGPGQCFYISLHTNRTVTVTVTGEAGAVTGEAGAGAGEAGIGAGADLKPYLGHSSRRL